MGSLRSSSRGVRNSLETAPEGLFGFLNDVISGEGVEQVSDLMVEDISENSN